MKLQFIAENFSHKLMTIKKMEKYEVTYYLQINNNLKCLNASWLYFNSDLKEELPFLQQCGNDDTMHIL